MIPGATQLTRMSGASSFASPTVIVSTAAFAPAYRTYSPAEPRVAAAEETFTIAPRPSRAANRRQHSSVPITLTA